jgi:hypothetical protein
MEGSCYGAPLSMGAFLGEPKVGAPVDPVGYERKALEMGISLL